jgi:hypothetical protein
MTNVTNQETSGILRLVRAVFFDEELSERDAASTLFRIFRSKHVADLQLIFKLVFLGWGLVLIIVVLDVSGCENPRKDGDNRRCSGWVRVIRLDSYVEPLRLIWPFFRRLCRGRSAERRTNAEAERRQ